MKRISLIQFVLLSCSMLSTGSFADSTDQLRTCKNRAATHYKQGIIDIITAKKRISECHTRKKYSDKLAECKKLVLTQLRKKEITAIEAKTGLKKCPDLALRHSRSAMLTDSQLEDILMGRLDFISGQKSLLVKTEDGGFRKVEPGDPVYKGETFRTDAKTAAELNLKDGEKIFVSNDTELTLKRVAPGKAETTVSNEQKAPLLDMKGGKIRALVPKKTDAKSKYKFLIKTRDFTLGVRGTEFVAETDENKSKLNTLEGSVDVAKNLSSLVPEKSEQVNAGEMTEVKKGDSSISKKEKFSISDFEKQYAKDDPEASEVLELDRAEAKEKEEKEKSKIEADKKKKLPKIRTVPLNLEKEKPILKKRGYKTNKSLVLDENEKAAVMNEQGSKDFMNEEKMKSIYSAALGYADSQIENGEDLDKVYMNVDQYTQKLIKSITDRKKSDELHSAIMLETKRRIKLKKGK